MDMMAIASASMSMQASSLMQNVAVAMMRKTMESAEISNAQLIEGLQNAAPTPAAPPSEHLLDVYV